MKLARQQKPNQSSEQPGDAGGASASRPSTGAGSAATLADSACFNSVGERKKMRLFICHENGRNTMDVPEGKTVGAIKQIIKDRFKIRVDRVQLGDINFERKTLVLAFAGAELDDRWILSDMGIKPGSTLRAYVKAETDPVLYLRLGHNEEIVPILDRLNLTGFPVSALRSMASRRSGLPVGIFRLTTNQGVEMFDCHSLDEYSVRPGDTVRVETWDGWSDLLRLAALGFTSHLLEKISQADEVQAKLQLRWFQLKVALYMAAHFGQVELSTTLTRQHGVRADEAVGPHPLRQWCTAERHPDLRKAPIHEAVEMGQLSVLRGFVHHNVCSIMVRDGAGLQPLNLALRQKQKTCASFLLTKQWSRIGYGGGTVPLTIFARMKNWSEKAKDRVAVLHGQEKSSLKKKQIKDYPLVGQGVYIDGFSQQQLNSLSRPPAASRETEVSRAIDRYYSSVFGSDPEEHFKKVTKMMKTPKQKSKWAKMAGGGNAGRGDQDAAAAGRADSASTTPPPTQQQATPGGVKLPPLQQSAEGAVYIETGKQPAKKQLQQKSQATTSSLQLTKAKGNDGAIPLPLQSVEDTPRPFLHLKKGQTNEVQQVLDLYYRQRGVPPRDYAIQCLSAAQNFKEKPWLHQVRLAMSFTETGVRKMTNKNSHNLFSSN